MLFFAQEYLVHEHNLCANRHVIWQIPQQVSNGEGGATPDISHVLMFCWFELVLYLDTCFME
jgi:hypothetical protein